MTTSSSSRDASEYQYDYTPSISIKTKFKHDVQSRSGSVEYSDEEKRGSITPSAKQEKIEEEVLTETQN